MEEVFANELKRKTYENIESPSAVPEIQLDQSLTGIQASCTKANCKENRTDSTPRPKKRSREIVQAINALSTLHEKVNNGEDETLFDVFGKSVAMQLKNLSMENALLAQQKIQCILSEIGIKDYRDKNGTKTSMSNYSYQFDTSPPSVQSNYAESCDRHQPSDENLSNMDNCPYIQEEEVITSDNIIQSAFVVPFDADANQ